MKEISQDIKLPKAYSVDLRERVLSYLETNDDKKTASRWQKKVLGKRFARKSVVSALLKGKLLALMCFEDTCNTTLFNVWLKQVLIPSVAPSQVLILDNASVHKSTGTQRLIKAAGCKMLCLLPYSPDLNPIEKYWANMKFKV